MNTDLLSRAPTWILRLLRLSVVNGAWVFAQFAALIATELSRRGTR
ncbi:MAG: hypothetical protein HY269_07575 [Deltaproteobacteria bacterium]|nr:hypothetical protein [Deltaproteobacteria bacterium]